MSKTTNAPEKTNVKKQGFNALVPVVLLVIGLVIMSVCYFNVNGQLTDARAALQAAEKKVAELENGQPAAEVETKVETPADAPVTEDVMAAKDAELTAANEALAAKEAELIAAGDALAAKEAELAAANEALAARDAELIVANETIVGQEAKLAAANEAIELAKKALSSLAGVAEEPAADEAPAAEVTDEAPVADEAAEQAADEVADEAADEAADAELPAEGEIAE